MRRQGIRWERALHHPHTSDESNRCRAEAKDPHPVPSPGAQDEEEGEHHQDEEELAELDPQVEPHERGGEGDPSEPQIDESGREREAVEQPEDERRPPPASGGTSREVLDGGEDDRQSDGRLDDARQRADDPGDGQREREGVGDGEGRDDLEDSKSDAPKRAGGTPPVGVLRENAREEQRNKEEEVVGARRDVGQPTEDRGSEAAALRRRPAQDVLSAVASRKDDRARVVAVQDPREPVMLRVGVEEEGVAHAEDVRVVRTAGDEGERDVRATRALRQPHVLPRQRARSAVRFDHEVGERERHDVVFAIADLRRAERRLA